MDLLFRSVLSDMFPCLMVLIKSLCFFIVYSHVFPVEVSFRSSPTGHTLIQRPHGEIYRLDNASDRIAQVFLSINPLGKLSLPTAFTGQSLRIAYIVCIKDLPSTDPEGSCSGENRGKPHPRSELFCEQGIVDAEISQTCKKGCMPVREKCDGSILENRYRSIPVPWNPDRWKSCFIEKRRNPVAVYVKQGINRPVQFMIPDGGRCFHDWQGDRKTDDNDRLCFRKNARGLNSSGTQGSNRGSSQRATGDKTYKGDIQSLTFLPDLCLQSPVIFLRRMRPAIKGFEGRI